MTREVIRIAKLVSLWSTPPIVAAFTFLGLLTAKPAPHLSLLMAISLVFGIAIPVSLSFFLVRRGTIANIYAPQRETRIFPFAGTISSYAAGVVALTLVKAPSIATALMLCYLVNTPR